MSRIAVDVDSTIYDFETAARDAFHKMAADDADKRYFMGAYIPWVEWRSPADALGVDTWLDVIDIVHQPENILKQVPYQGSIETLTQLVDEGHDLTYITSRQSHTENATGQWLKKINAPQWANLLCVQGDKAEHIKDCRYLIDDRPRTLVEFVYDDGWNWRNYFKNGRKAFSLMHEYNRALTDIPNIYLAPTWSGLNHYFVDKGLLTKPAYQALGV